MLQLSVCGYGRTFFGVAIYNTQSAARKSRRKSRDLRFYGQ